MTASKEAMDLALDFYGYHNTKTHLLAEMLELYAGGGVSPDKVRAFLKKVKP